MKAEGRRMKNEEDRNRKRREDAKRNEDRGNHRGTEARRGDWEFRDRNSERGGFTRRRGGAEEC
jgi:hypothetical protein